MITEDGIETHGDVQQPDDYDYALPFGVPDEDKPASLGFKDPPVRKHEPWYRRLLRRDR